MKDKFLYILNSDISYDLLISIVMLHFIIFIIAGAVIHIIRIKCKVNCWSKYFNSFDCNSFDVYLVYNAINKKFEYISPNLEKNFGINQDEIKKNIYVFFENIPIDKRKEALGFLAKDNITCYKEMEVEYTHPITKEKRWLSFHLYPIYKKNSITQCISCIKDISSKYYYAELQDALSKVQKANDAKNDFLSHISHEVKTPIIAINGMTQIALESMGDNEKIENCLHKIHYASSEIITLINNILDTSRRDSDKLILFNQPFHLKQILSSLIDIFNSLAVLKNQEFNILFRTMEDDYLNGDSIRLQEIIGNCISNSIKFTPLDGKIMLEVTELGKHNNHALFRFTIIDNGKGMKEEYLGRIFVPFEQEDSTIAKKYGGTGLGMSIAKNLVSLMGGDIKITSQVNIGTTVVIEIEFEVLEETDQPFQTIKGDQLLLNYDCTGIRVIVVEDNEINLEIICEFLKLLNVQYDTASNGFEAIKLFEASIPGSYHAILMDLHLPGMNGFDTAKIIRTSGHPDAAKISIIAITADNFVNEETILECGMDFFITKPIDIEKLSSLLYMICTGEKKNGAYNQ